MVRLCRLWVQSGGSHRSPFAHRIPDTCAHLDGPGCPEWPWWVAGMSLWVEDAVPVPSSSQTPPGSAPHLHWHVGGSPGLRLSNCGVLFLAWFPEEKQLM